MTHRTLKRQLKRCTDSDGNVDLEQLIELVNTSYQEADDNRRRIESTSRTLEEEVMNLNESLKVEMANAVESKNRVKEILDVIHQGIFTFADDYTVEDGYSPFLKEIIGYPEDKTLAGCDIFKLMLEPSNLSADSISQIRESFELSFQQESFVWETNAHLLPTEIIYEGSESKKVLALEWQPIYDCDQLIVRYMAVVRDLTDQRNLENKLTSERQEHQDTLNFIYVLTNSRPEQIQNFFIDIDNRLIKVENSLDDIRAHHNDIYINLHTIKGNSRSIGLKEIALLAHQAETALDLVSMSPKNLRFFNEILVQLRTKQDKYQDIFRNLKGTPDSELRLNLYDIVSQCLKSSQQRISSQNCYIEQFSCKDEVINWSSGEYEKIKSIVEHGITNCIDHGYLDVEDNKERLAIKINIEARIRDNHIELQVSDFGEGLPIKKLRQKIQADDSLTDEQVKEIFFRPGVSTSKKITPTSGRGVGLSAIKSLVNDLNGEVSLENRKEGHGTDLKIRFPRLVRNQKSSIAS